MTARNLKLLVLNDEENSIQADHLDLVSTALRKDYTGKEFRRNYLQSWRELVDMWSDGEELDFDVLIIDMKWDMDRSMGSYRGNSPMGLVLGMAVALRRASNEFPFAWVVHSGQPDLVADDPVAICSYGLLEAVCGAWRPITHDARAEVSSRIKSLPRCKPEDAVRVVMKRYRAEVGRICGQDMNPDDNSGWRWGIVGNYCELIAEELAKIRMDLGRLVSSYSCDDKAAQQELWNKLQDSHITVCTPSCNEEIRLRSLFADIDWEGQTAAQSILQVVTDWANGAESTFSIVPEVLQIIDDLRSSQNSLATATRPVPSSKRHLVTLGVITCSWLNVFSRNGHVRPTDLQEILNCDTVQLQREIKKTNLRGLTPSAACESLRDFGPRSETVLRAARKYWSRYLAKTNKIPRWLASS